MKQLPMRTCVVTKERLPKMDMFRIVKTNDGIIVDESGKINGHGCYIKKDIDTIMKAKDKKILNHVLETEVTDEVYDILMSKIK